MFTLGMHDAVLMLSMCPVIAFLSDVKDFKLAIYTQIIVYFTHKHLMKTTLNEYFQTQIVQAFHSRIFTYWSVSVPPSMKKGFGLQTSAQGKYIN